MKPAECQCRFLKGGMRSTYTPLEDCLHCLRNSLRIWQGMAMSDFQKRREYEQAAKAQV